MRIRDRWAGSKIHRAQTRSLACVVAFDLSPKSPINVGKSTLNVGKIDHARLTDCTRRNMVRGFLSQHTRTSRVRLSKALISRAKPGSSCGYTTTWVTERNNAAFNANFNAVTMEPGSDPKKFTLRVDRIASELRRVELSVTKDHVDNAIMSCVSVCRITTRCTGRCWMARLILRAPKSTSSSHCGTRGCSQTRLRRGPRR